MSAVNVHESACVLRARLGEDGVALMWRLMAEFEIEIAPFDAAQARAAIAAYGRYGKGVDPKARLNLADCAFYALAKTLDWPLLFKGVDFSATDVRVCRL